jgi:WD40 repeat protein
MFLTKTVRAVLVLAAALACGGAALYSFHTQAEARPEAKDDEVRKVMAPSRTLKGDFAIGDLAWGPDGTVLATIMAEHLGQVPVEQLLRQKTSVRIWDVRAGAVKRTLADDELRKHCWRFVAVAPDGKTVAASSEGNDRDPKSSGVVKVWDTATGELKHSLKHTLFARPVIFAPDGKTLATGTGGNCGRDFPTVQLWDARTGQLRRTGETTDKAAGKLAFAPDGKTLAAVLHSGDGETATSEVTLWDTAKGKLLRTVPDSDGFYHALAFAPDGNSLLGAARGKMRVWDVATGKVMQTSDLACDSCAACSAFAPDGKTLAASGRQKPAPGQPEDLPDGQGGAYVITVWDVKAAKLVRTLQGPEGFVPVCLAFSPDGKTLASGSKDGTIALWDFDQPATRKARAAQDEQLTRQIEKALKADGGEAKLTKLMAFTEKVVVTSGDGDTTITTTYSVQQPDQYRGEGETQIKSKGIKLNSVTVYNGENAWRKIGDGETTDNSVVPGVVKYFGPRAVLKLKDCSSKLTSLADTTVNERAAFGLALALAAGGKEVKFYFDKENGLLVKEVLKADDGTESETLYSDYKDFGGIPIAQKTTVKVNGQVQGTMEVTEFTIRDKLDAKLFQKP